MLPLRDTFYSEDFRSLPDCRSLLAGNSRPLNGYLGVLFEHRNVGHRQKRNPALPILSQRIVLSSERVSSCPSPNSSVEPYDLGYSGVPATIAHFIRTSPRGRFSRIDIDPCRTLTGLCLARDDLLHLVLKAIGREPFERLDYCALVRSCRIQGFTLSFPLCMKKWIVHEMMHWIKNGPD